MTMHQITAQYHQVDATDQRPVSPGFQAMQPERTYHHAEARFDPVAHPVHPRLPAGLDALATAEPVRGRQHPFKPTEALVAQAALQTGDELFGIILVAVAGQQRPANEQSTAVDDGRQLEAGKAAKRPLANLRFAHGLAVNALPLRHRYGFEVDDEAAVMGIGQVRSQFGYRSLGVAHDAGETGEVRGAGEEVTIALGQDEVASIRIHTQEGNRHGDGEEFAVAGLLALLPGQTQSLRAKRFNPIIEPHKGSDDGVLDAKIVQGMLATFFHSIPRFDSPLPRLSSGKRRYSIMSP